MTLDTELLKAMGQIVEGLVVLLGIFVYIKKGQYEDALGIVEGIFANAVSTTQATGSDNKLDMKPVAVKLVRQGLVDTKVASAVKKLGVALDDQVIGDMIERVLSSGKLGISSPIRDILKAKGKGAVLGFLSRKLNKIKV